MISLKRNNKGEFVEAKGIRTRSSSIYTPNQQDSFRISRSKFEDFISCQRCFYLDRVKGLDSPSVPGWSLNNAVDELLKNEFDICREKQIPHRLFAELGLINIVPFKHADIELWRKVPSHGLLYQVDNSNLELQGGIDDLWYNQETKEVIIVDYKAQSTKYPVETNRYLAGTYHQGYKNQLDFYAYLITKNGMSLARTGYFYVCNADKAAETFSGVMRFDETLVPYEWDSDWIEPKIQKMINILNSNELPPSNQSCENCAYANQRLVIEG